MVSTDNVAKAVIIAERLPKKQVETMLFPGQLTAYIDSIAEFGRSGLFSCVVFNRNNVCQTFDRVGNQTRPPYPDFLGIPFDCREKYDAMSPPVTAVETVATSPQTLAV
jgi:hypothetical protein